MEWMPQQPSPGFASRTVDAMLADAEREPRPRRFMGPMGLILAAALVATTAVGMYRAQKNAVPVVNVVVIPEVHVPMPAPPRAREVALEPESIKAVVARPRPPTAEPAAKKDNDNDVPIPRCSCLSDAVVCGCLEP